MPLEKLSSSDKDVYLMAGFNIDLLKSEISDLTHDFLLSLQSYYFFPVIDKPTRVYNNSATLIDNIFVNRFDHKISSGNSQTLVITTSSFASSIVLYQQIFYYCNFSEECFINPLGIEAAVNGRARDWCVA